MVYQVRVFLRAPILSANLDVTRAIDPSDAGWIPIVDLLKSALLLTDQLN